MNEYTVRIGLDRYVSRCSQGSSLSPRALPHWLGPSMVGNVYPPNTSLGGGEPPDKAGLTASIVSLWK
ncbi:hypothetical protein E2C01_086148 [Portunus trituberculatus]|uniref:Uncharacterized protein n=1 Tax=Portunus trituberculatus TaxID=210409 RepID=A0A5B7J004_PORTR|nr:hypothetical protein [Portunus trituberculatus]